MALVVSESTRTLPAPKPFKRASESAATASSSTIRPISRHHGPLAKKSKPPRSGPRLPAGAVPERTRAGLWPRIPASTQSRRGRRRWRSLWFSCPSGQGYTRTTPAHRVAELDRGGSECTIAAGVRRRESTARWIDGLNQGHAEIRGPANLTRGRSGQGVSGHRDWVSIGEPAPPAALEERPLPGAEPTALDRCSAPGFARPPCMAGDPAATTGSATRFGPTFGPGLLPQRLERPPAPPRYRRHHERLLCTPGWSA